MHPLRIAVVGYGHLGRAVTQEIQHFKDLQLQAVYSRRGTLLSQKEEKDFPFMGMERLLEGKEPIDVAILCGGSRTDLPDQSPKLSKLYNVVDSYDHHKNIPKHLAAVHQAALESQHVALISTGWDPGLFSLQRLYGEAFLPDGKTDTFWGPGLSQGHSDAIRRLSGVKDAVQYTLPKEEGITLAEKGQGHGLPEKSHLRQCFVVLQEGANEEEVRKNIQEMPDYFLPYETEVHFIRQEELDKEHSSLPHGGQILRTRLGRSGEIQLMKSELKLASNPAFTASVLLASARAVGRLFQRGDFGGKTLFDVPPAFFAEAPRESLIERLL